MPAKVAGQMESSRTLRDESGWCLWSPVSYSYTRVGEHKQLEQTQRQGERISILGLEQLNQWFECPLAHGNFKSSS